MRSLWLSIAEARAACRELRARNTLAGRARLGFVPTMGALHEGHLSLVRAAKAQCGTVAASIFVNPKQFAPSERISSKYPRSFEGDCTALEKEGVEIQAAAEEMYPKGESTWITVQGISDRLDGNSRPGHFRGVTTVVAKLFHIMEPEAAFFGQKDAAQVAIIRRMVRDLNFPVEIVVCPIVREPGGLAMSSRNVYLSSEERVGALALHRSLLYAEKEFRAGETDAANLAAKAQKIIAEEAGVRLDYFAIVDPDTLEPVDRIAQPALVAVAAYVGSTRLIDNLLLAPSDVRLPFIW